MERQHFAAELETLRAKLRRMGAAVEDRLGAAMEAVFQRRADLATPVLHGDGEINGLQMEIDDLSLKMLAQQQPVARDLRLITSVMKAATDLERVGDQAVNIAGTAELLARQASLLPLPDLADMAGRASRMLHEAVVAFLDGHVELARAVLASDDDVDALRDRVFRLVIERMLADPANIEPGLGLILVSRNLERIADHATNLAEDVVFLIEARDVRHHQGQA